MTTDILRKLLASTASANVRGSCVTLLGRLGDAASVATALSSDDRRVWQPAAAALRGGFILYEIGCSSAPRRSP